MGAFDQGMLTDLRMSLNTKSHTYLLEKAAKKLKK
jgi:hypothetical protein